MKALLMTICLVALLVGGCSYSQDDYSFRKDFQRVWYDEDEQFKNHTIFWSSVCIYPFFMVPFTEVEPIVIVLN